jgi:hypothetical protein
MSEFTEILAQIPTVVAVVTPLAVAVSGAIWKVWKSFFAWKREIDNAMAECQLRDKDNQIRIVQLEFCAALLTNELQKIDPGSGILVTVTALMSREYALDPEVRESMFNNFTKKDKVHA